MPIDKVAYKMLENVVGEKYISENEAVMMAYSRIMGQVGDILGGVVKPDAVTLPGSTLEVRDVIRICNRYKIPFVAFSTGLMPAAFPDAPGMLLMDLKRMNRIIRIDAKNRIALVEPGVTHAQLQSEVMKKGLFSVVPSSGPQCSVVASTTSWHGHSFHGNICGYNPRNLCAYEWVTPIGEVVKVGSAGVGAGWFSAEGPGPSLRGLRGYTGPASGLGVVTKAAVRLYPWPGPRVLQARGTSPEYEIELPEDKFKLLLFKMPSWKKLADAMYEIGKNEIGMCVSKSLGQHLVTEFTASSEEFWKEWASGYFQEQLKLLLIIFLSAWSKEELDYQEKVVREIIAETGGEEASRKVYEKTKNVMLGWAVRCWTTNRSWRPTAFMSMKGGTESIDRCVQCGAKVLDLKKPFFERGLLMDDGDNVWICAFEWGRYANVESIFHYDVHDREQVRAVGEMLKVSMQDDIERRLHASMHLHGDEAQKSLGPLFTNFHIYLMKIKKALDPNLISNPRRYIVPEESST
ncbi:MAG: FAD-binding oxidoreductase [Candidatus Bathyarchaeia archaeon]